jgi:hypothetical protein
VSVGFRTTFAYCFCGLDIAKSDVRAVSIAVTNLVTPRAVQSLYAHGSCAEKAVTAAPFDAEALAD